MIALALALVLQEPIDHQHIDIPAAYVGRWSLDPTYCSGDQGPAVLVIKPRVLNFYERTGYLSLAQLNEATDPPTFHGWFEFVSNLRFSEQVVRLEMIAGKLRVTYGSDPEGPTNPGPWSRCP